MEGQSGPVTGMCLGISSSNFFILTFFVQSCWVDWYISEPTDSNKDAMEEVKLALGRTQSQRDT